MTEQKGNQPEQRKVKKLRQFRINIFFFFIFLLFVALIVKLGVVQIVQGEEYSKEVSKTDADIAKFPAPRGKMIDKYRRVLVDNTAVPSITYTVDRKTKAKEKLQIAEKLAQYIEVPTDEYQEDKKVTDLKYYWLAANPEKAKKLLKDSELSLEPKETNKLQLERVPSEEIEKLRKDPEELEVAVIYTRFSSGYAYQPQVVKSDDLTEAELSIVAERLEELPGVDVITDWARKYPYDRTLRTIFGGLTKPEEGILEDRKSHYLARGYARNERVGKSFLELQYEDYLNPRKSKVLFTSDRNGNIVSEEVIDEGRRGYDLQLTFDIELQKEVDRIIEEEVREARSINRNVDRAFVVVMDPYKGDVLSLGGKVINENGETEDFAFGTFTQQFEMGSTVKGATVLAGYQNGISHGASFYDRPIKFAGTREKKSWRAGGFGWLNDEHALEVSSNVYMFYIAMDIAGVKYVPNGPFRAKMDAFVKMRNYFSQFGLGVPTGIDMPYESVGQKADPDQMGKLLDLAIGQFDTYTPLQMAQYVSTIANGGYRVAPRLLKSVHTPGNENELGAIVAENEGKILNRINNTPEDLKRVQEGFRLVTQGSQGTAAGKFGKYDVSGKTGTAETYLNGRLTTNLTFVGYYPSKQPEIAFSVVVPYGGKSTINKNIAKRVVEAYATLQEKYQSGDTEALTDEEKTQQVIDTDTNVEVVN
ncbi:penicillin-binding protein [Bacillus lacus]|uniref:serine-type D-Ala-D-Ala carboxypeptidase n=1 Tax=Metabacillus lacus TaxID=1983721 RepID=A0A7X2IYP6_9BACI|nr:penicillin-binding protein 2 [Metabacillus lacus]MRX72243.1 penicillin-binding protein [Metabacillus lacus]